MKNDITRDDIVRQIDTKKETRSKNKGRKDERERKKGREERHEGLREERKWR